MQAICEVARWETFDLVARRGREPAPNLLRGHSAELAGSPSGRDQLMSLALDQAANAIERGAQASEVDLSPLLTPLLVLPSVQASVRTQAAGLSSSAAEALRRHVANLLHAYRADGRSRRDDPSMTELLREDVVLNQALWADVRILADERQRAFMLASVPFLEAAAVADRRRLPLCRLLRLRCQG